MIKTRDDLKKIIKCDLKSLGKYPLSFTAKVGGILFPNQRWILQIRLRKLEYNINRLSNKRLFKILLVIMYKRYERQCQKMGCELPPGVFGPGLCINHSQSVIVNGFAKVGSNCRINAGVNIGSFGRFNDSSSNNQKEKQNAPIIGNNCYIGPGAKIFGAIRIGDNVAIGANAVVLKNVPDNATVVGVPGKILENKGSYNLIIYGDETVKPQQKK